MKGAIGLLFMIATASTTSTFGGIPGLDEIAGKLSPWASESIVPSHKNEHGCEVVYDDVWEEKCQTVYNEECATDYVNECQNVNHRECITKNEKQCSWGFKDSCVKIPVPTCNLVWEKKCGLKDVCTTVKERECRSVPKRICTTSHDKVCETREEKVCRQVPVPVETVSHYVPSSYPVESTGKHKSHGYGDHGDGKLALDLAGKHGESESYFGGFEDLTRGLTDLDFGLGEYGTHGSGHTKGHAGGGKQHKRKAKKVVGTTTPAKKAPAKAKMLNELLGGLLNAFLLPVYTWKEDYSLLTYFALPAVKILLSWICLNPKVLDSKAFLKRLQIWPSLCRLLNQLSTLTLEHITELESLASIPLPEDYDLQCFLPLCSNLKCFSFKKVSTFADESFKAKIPLLRAYRILKLGEQLASDDFSGRKVIACKSFEDLANSHEKSFEAIEQKIPQELIKDLDSADLDSSSEEEDPDGDNDSSEGNCAIQEPVVLKPSPVPEVSVMKKKSTHRTNVAMEAILRQAQTKHPAPSSTLPSNSKSLSTSNNNNSSSNSLATPPLSNPASQFHPLSPPGPIRPSRPDFSIPPPRMLANLTLNMRPRAAPERPMSLNGSPMTSGFGWINFY